MKKLFLKQKIKLIILNFYIMKKVFICLNFALLLLFGSCNSAPTNNEILGEWKEYRADGNNYGLSSWKFNGDGTGLFVVNGLTNTQRVAFTWKKIGSSTIEIQMNGEYTTLELSNGLLLEESFGETIVFKR